MNASTQSQVIAEFETRFVEEELFSFPNSFTERVLQINKYEPSKEFAEAYLTQATAFYLEGVERREELRVVNS